jgi:hypothetical protein
MQEVPQRTSLHAEEAAPVNFYGAGPHPNDGLSEEVDRGRPRSEDYDALTVKQVQSWCPDLIGNTRPRQRRLLERVAHNEAASAD